jgi:hypothetical protein
MVVMAMRCDFPEAVPREGVVFLAEVFRGGVSLPI